MLKIVARLASLALCLAASGLAFAQEQAQEKRSAPQALTEAQLDGITAGSITFHLVSVFNPGNADVFKISPDGTRIHCVNCSGPTHNPGTSVGLVLIKTHGRSLVKCNGSAPGC